MTVTLDLQFGLNRVFCFRIFAIIKMSIEAVISFQGSAAKGSPSNFTWLLAEFRALQGTGLRASISCWLFVWGFLQFHRALNRQFQQHRQFCQHPLDHRERRRVPEKHPLLLYWLCQSLWLCGSQQTVENSSGNWNSRPSYLPSEKSVCRSRSTS